MSHEMSSPSLLPCSFSASLQDLASSLFLRCLCGDRIAFDQLESLAHNEDAACLGYLMLLLHPSDTTAGIPTDEVRALSIARDIVPRLTTKIRQDLKFPNFRDFDDKSSFNPHEQLILGCVWRHGIGVAKDEFVAVKLFTLAANQGLAQAQCNFGWCYSHGAG
jgi:TPR repeat protein